MATRYTYPQVNITTTTLQRKTTTPVEVDNVILFIPFISRKGPNNVLTKVRNYDEFVDYFGEVDYKLQGETGLVIKHWLDNGGTLLGYRLAQTGNQATATSGQFSYYEGLDGTEGSDETLFKATLVESPTRASVLNGNYCILDSAKYIATTAYRTDYQYYEVTPDESGNLKRSDSPIVKATAKYNGEAYNEMQMTISNYNSSFYSIVITFEGSIVVNSRVLKSSLESYFSQSDYIDSDFTLDDFSKKLINLGNSFTFTFSGAEAETETLNSLVKQFYDGSGDDETGKKWNSVISDSLETPINVILDPGYEPATKDVMLDFLYGSSEISRNDINFVMTEFYHKETTRNSFDGQNNNVIAYNDSLNPDSSSYSDLFSNDKSYNSDGNISIYTNAVLVNDSIAGKNIWTTPSYFISMLIPTNDNLYGIQYPLAGMTRGVLSGVLGLKSNPTPSEKEAYFESKINYIEKDSRGYKFMSQRTHDSKDDTTTALSFLNNARVRNKIIQDLTLIGRQFLFEFNDATTISNMTEAMTQYINTWIQNRTLSDGSVVVEADEYSAEIVNVDAKIKFTGTIEYIPINIVIE